MSSSRLKSIRRLSPRIKHCVIPLAVLALGTSAAAAQSVPGDYAGKQIRMVIAAGAGGGYDTYARFLARHLHKHIAGSPSVISQNMPGAAGMTATNWAYSVAPKDGTVILATYNSLLPEPLYGNPAARFDPRRFEAVGSISRQQNICATWHTSPIKTIAQARTRELTVAATGATGDSATLPKILNAVAGTRFKVISGYGTTEQRLAVERGDATGGRSQGHGAYRRYRALMPPDTPKALVATIRRAFDATMRDPAFLAEAEKSLFDVDPLSGEEMHRILERAYATPKALVQRAAEFNGSGGP